MEYRCRLSPGPGAGKEGGGYDSISTVTDFSEGLEVSNNI